MHVISLHAVIGFNVQTVLFSRFFPLQISRTFFTKYIIKTYIWTPFNAFLMVIPSIHGIPKCLIFLHNLLTFWAVVCCWVWSMRIATKMTQHPGNISIRRCKYCVKEYLALLFIRSKSVSSWIHCHNKPRKESLANVKAEKYLL